jgi:hypothetical protein
MQGKQSVEYAVKRDTYPHEDHIAGDNIFSTIKVERQIGVDKQ